MNDPKLLKLYIAVLDEVPDHMVPVLVAHAVLGAHMKFVNPASNPNWVKYDAWFLNSFKKVVLRVNRKEFEKIKALDDVFLAHENSTLGGEKSCAVVCPRCEIPNVLKFAKMWKPKATVPEDYERNDKEGWTKIGNMKIYYDDELQ